MAKEDLEKIKEIDELDLKIREAKRKQEVLLEEHKMIETVYKWEAPERVYYNKERQWYITIAFIAMIVIVYALLSQNFILVLVVIGVVFLMYALNTVPAAKVTHEITNKGIYIFEELLTWNKLLALWVSRRGDHTLISFEVQDSADTNPRKVILLLGDGDLEKIVGYIVQFVDYWSAKEVGQNFITRRLEGNHVPLVEIIKDESVKTKNPNDSLQGSMANPENKEGDAK